MKNALAEGLYKQNNLARRLPAPGCGQIKSRARLGEAFQARESMNLSLDTSDVFLAKQRFSNHLLKHLPPETAANLTAELEPVTLAASENLYKPGENIRYIYFPETAVVSHLYMLADGNTSEVAMVGAEGIVGLCAVFSHERPQFWTEVTVPGEAFRLKTKSLKDRFGTDSFLRALVLDYANSHISQISQRTVCNTHHVAEARLCSWLLMLHDRVKSSRLPLTQDKIARYLGVNRPSITHIAQLLREKGMIDYTRGFINILDRPSLEKTACECYEMNHENGVRCQLL